MPTSVALLLTFVYFGFALWKLRPAVLVLPAFFPAYLLRFDVAGLPFNLVEGFIYALVAAWFIHGRFARFGKTIFSIGKQDVPSRSFFAREDRWLWFGCLLIVIGSAIGVVIAQNYLQLPYSEIPFNGQKIALGIFKSWIIAPLLMFIVFYKTLRADKDLRWLFDSYVGGAVFLGLWACFQVVSGNYLTIDHRASGPFESANYLSLYITPALFYTIAYLKAMLFQPMVPPKQGILARLKNSKMYQWFHKFLPTDKSGLIPDYLLKGELYLMYLSGIVLFFALLFSKSYAAMLALLVAGFFYFFFQRTHRAVNFAERLPEGQSTLKTLLKGFGILLCIGVVLFTILALLDPNKWTLFFELFQRSSSSVRLQIYTISSNLIAQGWFLGQGLGQFPALYEMKGAEILGQVPYETIMLHPHNFVFAAWLNTGLIGLAGFITVIVICFKKSYIAFIKPVEKGPAGREWIRAVVFGMLLIILFHGLVDTPFFKNDLALMFWLLVAGILL